MVGACTRPSRARESPQSQRSSGLSTLQNSRCVEIARSACPPPHWTWRYDPSKRTCANAANFVCVCVCVCTRNNSAWESVSTWQGTGHQQNSGLQTLWCNEAAVHSQHYCRTQESMRRVHSPTTPAFECGESMRITTYTQFSDVSVQLQSGSVVTDNTLQSK